VSVVVPFFDSEETIEACIDSLRRQEGVDGDFEIVFVDNGSSDSSTEIARSHEGVTLIEERTPGAYAARNAGIALARAPLIAFTDADCIPDRDWLRSILQGMEDDRVGIQIGHCRYPGNATLTLRLLELWENAKAECVVGRCSPEFHFAYCNNMAVRTSVFDVIGPFREWRRAADTELVHRLAASRLDLELVYDREMRVTHLEFVRGTKRARRLSLYRQTNARIETFRELGGAQRLGVLAHLVGHPWRSW
jgi:glycosyltransferase involved in cell wall biosynthesis